MAVFLGIHKVEAGASEGDLQASYDSYKKSAMDMGLTPLGAVASIEKEFAYCQTEAESADQVREAHAKVNVPLEDVVMVIPLS